MVNIINYIRIKGTKVSINGKALNIDFSDTAFLKAIYKHLGIKYPKFHKMDELSKLGFVASEMLLQNEDVKEVLSHIKKEEIGLILQNSDSSVDVDRRFYDSIVDEEKHFPSPALFVYTLPNIVLGEISIRNKFMGENGLFIFENYNPQFGVNYINTLFEKGKIKACVGGWFNANNGEYDAFLYLLNHSQEAGNKHTIENIKKLY